MADYSELELDDKEFSIIGPAIGLLVEIREREILSICRGLIDDAFADSLGKLVIDVMLGSTHTLTLGEIASKCESGRRAVSPDGRLRGAIERMVKAGVVTNHGNAEKPRFSLNRADMRVQMLAKMYARARFTEPPKQL